MDSALKRCRECGRDFYHPCRDVQTESWDGICESCEEAIAYEAEIIETKGALK
jgi:hypothetical protein